MSDAPRANTIAPALPHTAGGPWTPIGAASSALLTVALFWLCSGLDLTAHRALADPASEAWTLAKAFKALGTIWPWLALGAVITAAGVARGGRSGALRRGAFLLVAAAASGALADALKVVFRRERPEYHEGFHVFRPLSDRPLYGGGLDLPSSHAATAFGAAWALGAIFPRLAWLWLALAAGCAFTRVLEGAHTLSAAALAGALAWAVARTVRAVLLPPTPC